MKTNVKKTEKTFEGGNAHLEDPFTRLKRSVLSCMLWEDQFYEEGVSVAERIQELSLQVKEEALLDLVKEAKSKYLLRHAPLWLLVAALRRKIKCKDEIVFVCSRPDQMTELLSLYWKEGRRPLSAQLKKGLAIAFQSFDEYQLSKYNRKGAIKLRDVLFLSHAKPKNKDQERLWKRLINNELKIADTWETRLSKGKGKKESFTELLESGKLGKLAILRNLRNMKESGVDKDLVKRELLKNPMPMLPFQFITAAAACPGWEDIVDQAMIECASKKPKLEGHTVLLVDVSGSMESPISSKSQTSLLDAACALATLLKEIAESIEIFSFSNALAEIAPRRGMALRDAIIKSQPRQGTYLGRAVLAYYTHFMNNKIPERIIVITDEQTHDAVPKAPIRKGAYILNIASYEKGIDHKDHWTVISGFSEASIDYIKEIESLETN